MIDGITRGIVLVCSVNAILAAGSSRIYAKDLPRNPRDASCSSCGRDRPDGLSSWSSPSQESREGPSSSWSDSAAQSFYPSQSSQSQYRPLQPQSLQYPPLQPQSLQPPPLQPPPLQPQPLQYPPLPPPLPQFPQPGSSVPLNPINPYSGAAGGRGGPGVVRPWGVIRRENPVSFGSRDFNPDLAPAPASPVYSMNPLVSPLAPFQPFSPVIRTPGTIPSRRPTVLSLTESQSSQLNQGALDFAPIQMGSVYENPKPKLSVVYRADKYNDDSSEEDKAPLYPSDYPRTLVNGGPDNVYPMDYPRRPRIQVLTVTGSQGNAPPSPVDYLSRVGDVGRQDSRNLAAAKLTRAEVIVKPQRELRVLNGAGYSSYRDTRMADTGTKPQGDLQDVMMDAALRQPQIDHVQDAGMSDRIVQGDQPRDSRTADRFMQPRIDQTQDTRMLQSLAKSQKDQPRESRMAGTFVQPQDQSRDSWIPDQFTPDDNLRVSSVMQLPEARPQDMPPQIDILKVIKHIGNMFANRTSSVEPKKDQEGDQQGAQPAKKTNENDQAHESKVSPGPGEVKEKREAADGERVPAMAKDMLEVSSLEEILSETTPKIADMAKFETMD